MPTIPIGKPLEATDYTLLQDLLGSLNEDPTREQDDARGEKRGKWLC